MDVILAFDHVLLHFITVYFIENRVSDEHA